jgi:hypothetical protein
MRRLNPGWVLKVSVLLRLVLDYALAQEAFADPELMRRRRHRETVKAYLADHSVDPVPLRRLAARHPDKRSELPRVSVLSDRP